MNAAISPASLGGAPSRNWRTLTTKHQVYNTEEHITIKKIATLFSQPRATLIGWFHFLALDLWAGAWEAEDAGRRGTPHARLLPCLILTLLAGPAGLLLYLVLRGRERPALADRALQQGGAAQYAKDV